MTTLYYVQTLLTLIALAGMGVAIYRLIALRKEALADAKACLLYTSPSPRD